MRHALVFIASALFSGAAIAQVGTAGAGAGAGAAGAGAPAGVGAAGAGAAIPGPGARSGATGSNILTNNSPFNGAVTNNTNQNAQLFNSQGPAVTTFNNAFTNTPGGANFGFAGQPGAANPFTVTGAGQNGAIPIRGPQSTITTSNAPARVFDFSTNDTSLNPWMVGGNSALNPNQQVR